MQPGMVSPFLHPEQAAHLSALVLLPWRELWEAQEREVALSLSLWESLALPCALPAPAAPTVCQAGLSAGAPHRTGQRRRYPVLCRG